jgi:hypothetical protein
MSTPRRARSLYTSGQDALTPDSSSIENDALRREVKRLQAVIRYERAAHAKTVRVLTAVIQQHEGQLEVVRMLAVQQLAEKLVHKGEPCQTK